MSTLEGQVAVVTGSGRGIGRALALAFAREGAAVVCAARTASEVEAVAAEIEAVGAEGVAVPTDITDRVAVDALFAEVGDRYGKLDLLALNAGAVGELQPVADSDPDAWWSVFEANVLGQYLCARAAIPLLQAAGGGRIMVMGSGARYRAGTGWSAYSPSKAALWSLTRVLAVELRPDRIAVNEIIPGPVRTELMEETSQKLRNAVGSNPMGAGVSTDWWKEPEAVADLALYLARLPVDGPTAQSFSLLGRDA